MKRLSVILDKDGFPIRYADAAERLGISVASFRNRLAHYRRQHSANEVPLDELRAYHVSRNPLLDQAGDRISYAGMAEALECSRGLIYRLVGELRRRGMVRHGEEIPWSTIAHHISTENKINFADAPMDYVPDMSWPNEGTVSIGMRKRK